MGKNKPLLIGVIIVIIAIAAYFLIRMNNNTQVASDQTTTDSGTADNTTSAPLESINPQANQNTDTASGPTTPATPPTHTSPSTYKDGSYTATGHYISPGGNQGLQVTVTLKGDVVTSVSAVSKAVDPESNQFQQKFLSGYQSLVVGKDIDTVKLTKVSGSSLTSGGFNDAIKQIKAQAKS